MKVVFHFKIIKLFAIWSILFYNKTILLKFSTFKFTMFSHLGKKPQAIKGSCKKEPLCRLQYIYFM